MIRFLFAVVMSLCALATAPAYGLEFRQGYSGGNCDHCAWIAADGAITADSDKELLEFMRRKGIESYSNLLVINSPGGDLRGGLKLGELMRLRKMTVIVGRTEDQEVEGAGREFQSYDGGVCASACVFVLMGGVARELADDESRVGIHQFAPAVDSVSSEAGTTARTQTTVAILQSFAMKMGVDPSVITLASMTNSDDIYWLSIKSMESSNLLTTRSSAEPSDWTLKPVGTSLAAFARQEQSNGLYTTYMLKCNVFAVVFNLKNPGRIQEISDSIKGADIQQKNTYAKVSQLRMIWKSPSSSDGTIYISFQGGPNLLRLIANGGDRLQIGVDVPHAYMAEFGGWNFDIPSSNLGSLIPHIQRSCPAQ